jgi:hypothetical protein
MKELVVMRSNLSIEVQPEKALYQEKITLTLKQTSKGYTTAVTG